MLGRDLAIALDPVRLPEAAGIVPDPWQAGALRSETKRGLWLAARQSGKSLTAAGKALHQALYTPRSLVLLLSPSLRQSAELFRKVLDLYSLVGKDSAPLEASSTLRLELRNGSRVISLPGTETTIRGYSGVDLLLIDEASRVPDGLYASVRPMLAVSGGRLIALTTPAGKRGFFYREWTEGGLGWERVLIKATDCPRISQDFLDEERASLGEYFFRQEYFCEFVDAENQLFSTELIERMLNPAIRPLFPQLAAPLGMSSDLFFDADIQPLAKE